MSVCIVYVSVNSVCIVYIYFNLSIPLLTLLLLLLLSLDLTPPPSSILLQSESSHIGIRTIHTTVSGILTLNNRSITIRGANLHEHDPIKGHTISPQLAELDVVLLKRYNFNAVRTSHYPHTPWFYQLCTGECVLLVLFSMLYILYYCMSMHV